MTTNTTHTDTTHPATWTDEELAQGMAYIRLCIGGSLSAGTVRAMVHGAWAYHPATGPDARGWSVTHVSTGKRVAIFEERSRARKCVWELDTWAGHDGLDADTINDCIQVAQKADRWWSQSEWRMGR